MNHVPTKEFVTKSIALVNRKEDDRHYRIVTSQILNLRIVVIKVL